MVISGDPFAFLNYQNKESNLKNDKTKGPDKILVEALERNISDPFK